MRLTLMVVGIALLSAASSGAQTPTPAVEVYNLDPYDPSDAELLRQYGAVLVAQTPLLELRKLDTHTPSHAKLLRDLGGAIPLWALWYPPTPFPASLTPFQGPTGFAPAPAGNIVFVLPGQADAQADDAASSAPAADSAPASSSPAAVTLRRPENNDGVWISYAGQKWISAGPALALDQSAFSRVGEYSSVPVFKREGAAEDVIYVAASDDARLVVPYRLKP